MAVNLQALKDKLIESNQDANKVGKSIAYLSDSKVNETVQKHTNQEMYSLIVKYLNVGTNLDGVNVILAGKNMGLVTYQGYMNKVKQLHPDVFFDVQLVREGDEFEVGKRSGLVEYTHKIANPFASYDDKKINGAYCVVKFDNNESIELLNERDYNEMQGASKSSYTWKKWPSEFWRKSVIKRACKVYFSEEVALLEKVDNEDHGLAEDDDTSDNALDAIVAAKKG